MSDVNIIGRFQNRFLFNQALRLEYFLTGINICFANDSTFYYQNTIAKIIKSTHFYYEKTLFIHEIKIFVIG